MIRLITRCALAPLLSACVLMLSPVASWAESVGSSSAQMVEVKYIPNQEGEDKIVVPVLGKHYIQLENVERQYYFDLFEITAEVCKDVAPLRHSEHEGYFVETGSQVGFSAQLIKFNTVRNLLNRLLYRFKLGLAPNFEDFNGVNELEYHQYAKPSKRRPPSKTHETTSGWVEESIYPNDTGCIFTIVSYSLVGMK
jgi:hypothetical protein